MTRAELKSAAKASLKGHYGLAIGASVATVAIPAAISFTFSSWSTGSLMSTQDFGKFFGTLMMSSLLSMAIILVFMAAVVGGHLTIYLKLARAETAAFSDLFCCANRFPKFLWAQILIGIFTYLWSLLFIIPGIIAQYRYSQALYLLTEHPHMSAPEAIDLSKQMMNGHKMEYFVLQLSFVGWMLLGGFTLGLLYLWLVPYMTATMTQYYNYVFADYKARESAANV